MSLYCAYSIYKVCREIAPSVIGKGPTYFLQCSSKSLIRRLIWICIKTHVPDTFELNFFSFMRVHQFMRKRFQNRFISQSSEQKMLSLQFNLKCVSRFLRYRAYSNTLWPENITYMEEIIMKSNSKPAQSTASIFVP